MAPLVFIEDISGAFLAALEAPIQQIHNRAFNVGRACENYQIRDLAEIVHQVCRCQVEYAGKPGPDPRDYRVDFTRITRELPAWHPRWTAQLGAKGLIHAFRQKGMTQNDFQGWRFTRLAQLKRLIKSGSLDPQLRWRQGFYDTQNTTRGEELKGA